MKILDNFADVKVLVVGDVMLDRYWWGRVGRISPEAPVPVVSLERTSLIAGGAANVAANVAGLGAKPFLFGITGKDEGAKLLPEVLQKSNISAFELFPIKDRKTTVKTRIVAHNQQVVRLDQETSTPLNTRETASLLKKIEAAFDLIDVVILSDYAKGFLTDELIRRLISQGKKKGKIVLIDPKGKDYSKYSGATILTPNQREAADACGLEDNCSNLVERSGEMLLERLGLKALLITQGEKGMTLLQKGKSSSYLPATARKVYDVTGAGDTAIATMAVALGSGMDFLQAAEIANTAAGLVVEKIGTTPITREMLESAN
ncbi:MAG: D-glycero-beta-D-manno-heptose-7-phosphate kinase [Blastocatellia bacterium]|nr:D-glycero-beta-D-manno-heptose-7-phosphate kinase [Blastocatellia bacterium]MDQ3221616.1 D-glycero-beta-D-manno-heptose-7-phosphate kinase [Acidobacteriota bacterium]